MSQTHRLTDSLTVNPWQKQRVDLSPTGSVRPTSATTYSPLDIVSFDDN
ncbi:hypothetical protein MY3296_002822 [Beauveria thailandica]